MTINFAQLIMLLDNLLDTKHLLAGIKIKKGASAPFFTFNTFSPKSINKTAYRYKILYGHLLCYAYY